MTNKKPMKIKHINSLSTDDRQTLCQRCGQSLHMTKGEMKLLTLYSTLQDGFKPSAKFVTERTNISRAQMFEVRNLLIKHGVAAINNNCLYIDWNRIRLFSTLDPDLTGRHSYIAPVEIKKPDYKVLYSSQGFYDFLQFGEQDAVINSFSKMTEEQYKACRESLRKRAS